MKVLHVDSARTWRGGQNQVLLAASGMARRGHRVAIGCRRDGALEARAREAGIDVIPLIFHGDVSPLAAWELRRALGRYDPDVLQLHDPHAISVGLMASSGRRAARVATRRVDFAVRRGFSRWKYLHCGRVVAVSRAIERVLKRDGVPAHSVRLVYEGVPDRAPLAGGRDSLRALGVPAGARVVGNVAALTEHKDQETLIAAARLVVAAEPDVHFVIVGAGELQQSLTASAASAGITDHVTFTGFRTDIDRLIPAFDVFCLTSILEGLGTSLLDAMAFRRPIVATTAGGIPEAVVDGETGRLVPPRGVAELAEALLELLRDASRARDFGAAGRSRFEALFTDERMVSETLRVYEELL